MSSLRLMRNSQGSESAGLWLESKPFACLERRTSRSYSPSSNPQTPLSAQGFRIYATPMSPSASPEETPPSAKSEAEINFESTSEGDPRPKASPKAILDAARDALAMAEEKRRSHGKRISLPAPVWSHSRKSSTPVLASPTSRGSTGRASSAGVGSSHASHAGASASASASASTTYSPCPPPATATVPSILVADTVGASKTSPSSSMPPCTAAEVWQVFHFLDPLQPLEGESWDDFEERLVAVSYTHLTLPTICSV